MQFLYSPLTWGFLLVGVPVLVHLINLLRHRRQKWAAMEFLLESYRRNRRWVMLKQWLLLAARMLAMALLVMMLAKWVSSSQWLSWLGGKTTHHYILLDDSLSMGARQQQNDTAYDRALRSLSAIVQDISSQPGDHQITLIRWSRAAMALQQNKPELQDTSRNSPENARKDQPDDQASKVPSDKETSNENLAGAIDLAADLLAQTVTVDPSKLLDRISATQPTALQLSPQSPLELIQPNLTAQTGELPVVYMLTDLRRNQFSEDESLRAQFQQLNRAGVALQLIDCAEAESANLTLASISPEQEVWAAGVPVMVRFSVRNASAQSAKNVVCKVRTVMYAEGQVTPLADQTYSGSILELPPVVLESIEPGQTVTRQVQVVFSTAGSHAVEISIPEDSLSGDNVRWCTIDITQSQRVLLVDGDVKQANAYYFESVMQPGERLQTGMTFEKVDASYLRDVADQDLSRFDVVALLDVPRLDVQAVERLLEFVQNGGGLFIMCGPNTNLKFSNEQLYRGGAGILPVEFTEIQENPEQAGSIEPQVTAADHPVLEPLKNLATNPFFALRIQKQLVPSQQSLQQSGLQIIANGPGGYPIFVDRGLGKGRTLALLTGISSQWSSWAQDPTFVVLALRSLGYLGSFRRSPTEYPVGSDLLMVVKDRSMLPQGDILLPTNASRRVRLQRNVQWNERALEASLNLPADLQAVEDRAILDGLLRSGVYESWMTTSDGVSVVHNQAHNVAPEEGNLERISPPEFERQFQGLNIKLRSSSNITSGLNSRESTQSNLVMALLIALLLGEQMLAYSASYHTRAAIKASGLASRQGASR